MRHLLLPGTLSPGQRLTISGDEFHYLVHVRRHAAGDTVQATDSGGHHFLVELADVSATQAVLRVAAADPSPALEPELSVTVCQAVPKARKLDDAIRRLVQAGATTIVPVFTDRTVVRPTEPGSAKQERWHRVAKEAVQQSGATSVSIRTPCSLADALHLHQPDDPTSIALYLHTEPLAQGSLHGYLGESVSHLVLFVGPEGGFSPDECERFQNNGVQPLWLGPRVYRTETAGLVAVAAARLILLERSRWQLTK